MIDRHATLERFAAHCVNMKKWSRQHGINYDNLYAFLTRSAPPKMTDKQKFMVEKLKEDGLYVELK